MLLFDRSYVRPAQLLTLVFYLTSVAGQTAAVTTVTRAAIRGTAVTAQGKPRGTAVVKG